MMAIASRLSEKQFATLPTCAPSTRIVISRQRRSNSVFMKTLNARLARRSQKGL